MSQPTSIVAFLRTRKLGPLELGKPQAVVDSLLGSPEDVGRGVGKARIHQYASGRLELTFSKAGDLVLIALFPLRGTELVGLPLLDDLPPEVRHSSAQFARWLGQERIPFEVIDADPHAYAVRLHTGVWAAFQDGSLYTLQCS